jgi:hypothetical protein
MVDPYRRFGGMCCLHLQARRANRRGESGCGVGKEGPGLGLWLTDRWLDQGDRGSTFLRIVGNDLEDYTASYPMQFSQNLNCHTHFLFLSFRFQHSWPRRIYLRNVLNILACVMDSVRFCEPFLTPAVKWDESVMPIAREEELSAWSFLVHLQCCRDRAATSLSPLFSMLHNMPDWRRILS